MHCASATLVLSALSALTLLAPAIHAAPGCMPTNASKAFTQIPLQSPSSGSGYFTFGHAIWPPFLDDSTLVWPLSGGDSILIASFRTQGISINLDGSVTYTFPPNTYANRVGTIVTANDWTDGGNGTFPVLTASFTFSDGRQWGSGTAQDVPSNSGKALSLVHQVRNWSNQVMPSRPDFVLRPGDPRVFELYAGPAVGAGDSVFSDLQTFNIPDTLRSAQLSSVTFSSYSEVFGFPITSTTALITGLVVWPDFEIRNRHGGTVGLQKQTESAYANRAYGGYIVRDTLFGSRKTFNALGCMLSCMAMINSFFGDSVTVLGLNKYLALNMGFAPTTVCTLSTVSGQDSGATVTWHVASGAKLMPSDTVLIEVPGSAYSNPLVTLVTGPTNTQGTIIRRHRSGFLSSGLTGVGYDDVLPIVASQRFSQSAGRPWMLKALQGNPTTTPRKVEAALADSLPVLLKLPGHFAVAHGRKPSVGADAATGTYVIRDPGHSTVTRLNDVFIANEMPKSFANTYISARSCIPADTSRYAPSYSAHRVAADAPSVTMVVQGGARLAITDPDGNLTYYNDDIGAYVSDLPDVSAWADYGAGLDDDPDNADDGIELVEIPGGVEGGYRIVALSDATAEIGVGVIAVNANQVGGRDFVLRTVAGGQGFAFVAQVVQSPTPGVQITPLGTTDVADRRPGGDADLLVRPNPSRGKIEMEVLLSSPDELEVQVFDLAGRLIAEPFEGSLPAGRHLLHWDPTGKGSIGIRTGILFVRMRTQSQVVTRRIVVIQ